MMAQPMQPKKLESSVKLPIVAASKPFLIDQMTWRQWLNNALKRSYGIFGEGVEYSFLHVDDKVAYIRVNHVDKDTFSSSISTYISTDELVGSPLTVSILQESSSLRLLEVTDDDRLWLKKVMEEEEQDCTCI